MLYIFGSGPVLAEDAPSTAIFEGPLPPDIQVLDDCGNDLGSKRFFSLFSLDDRKRMGRKDAILIHPYAESSNLAGQEASEVYYANRAGDVGFLFMSIDSQASVCLIKVVGIHWKDGRAGLFALKPEVTSGTNVSVAALLATKDRVRLCLAMRNAGLVDASVPGWGWDTCGPRGKEVERFAPTTTVIGLTVGSGTYALVSNQASVHIIRIGE